MGLDSEIGKVWVIMSLGVGSMTISHANDSYFWVVSQMGNIDVKKAYKTHYELLEKEKEHTLKGPVSVGR